MNYVNGERIWTNPAGKIHREDGPAIEYISGGKEWWLDGKRHRTDGPALVWAEGTKQWFFNGKVHRVDGPAVEYSNGDKQWWRHDNIYRTDGPAIERGNGTFIWRLGNKKTKMQMMEYMADRELSILFLARAINPFCKINVAKYAL